MPAHVLALPFREYKNEDAFWGVCNLHTIKRPRLEGSRHNGPAEVAKLVANGNTKIADIAKAAVIVTHTTMYVICHYVRMLLIGYLSC